MIVDKLLEFIDELLALFEDNKIVYKRLILLHHKVRNVFDMKTVEDTVNKFLTDNEVNRTKIRKRDCHFLKHTPFEFDFYLVWDELTTANKFMVWKWIDSIANEATGATGGGGGVATSISIVDDAAGDPSL